MPHGKNTNKNYAQMAPVNGVITNYHGGNYMIVARIAVTSAVAQGTLQLTFWRDGQPPLAQVSLSAAAQGSIVREIDVDSEVDIKWKLEFVGVNAAPTYDLEITSQGPP